MTGPAVGLDCFTLTFDSSPIKGEGILLVGVVLLLPRPVDSRLRGNDGPWWLCCLVVALPCGYCLKASMTGCSCGFAVPSPLPLWIADQVRNDVTMLGHRFHPHL